MQDETLSLSDRIRALMLDFAERNQKLGSGSQIRDADPAETADWPQVVLDKLRKSGSADLGDVARMLVRADGTIAARIRAAVATHEPRLSRDLDRMLALAALERSVPEPSVDE